MPDLLPQLLSALILGLLGGGHCLGMCGGLMGALTMAIPKEQRSRRFRLLLAYNVGRIFSYACAGLLIGLAGWAVANSPGAMVLRVVAALLLITMGFYLAGWWSGLTRIMGLAAVWAGLQHPVVVGQSGQCAVQRAADAGFRHWHLAGPDRHGPCCRAHYRALTQTKCTCGRRPAGHPVRPVDPAGPAPALVDGALINCY
jgi:MFS family permease